MSLFCKHFLNPISCRGLTALALILLAFGTFPLESHAQEARSNHPVAISNTAGSIAPGPTSGGIISELYVAAPPNYHFQLEKTPGSFVNCGEGFNGQTADKNGRQTTTLSCGVTITETLVIPAAAQSARLVVHY